MTIRPVRRWLFAGIGCIALLGAGMQAHASASYPDRPLKLMVGYAPGGGIDILGRFLAQHLSDVLDQPVVVENRAGASGALAARGLTTASADGYTLFMGESASLVAPALQNAPYDPVKDFQPVAQVGALVYGIAVHPDVPVESMDELVTAVRNNPGEYHYGSPGIGNIVHLGAEGINRSLDLDMTHVPYKGGAPMLGDLMSGQIPIGMTSLASLVTLEQSNRVRLIGVTSMERSELYPDVQALSELQPGFEAVSNIYLVAPAGTPKAIVDTLNQAVNKVMRTQEAQDYFAQQGSLVRLGTPDDLGRLIAHETAHWGQLVEDFGISAQ